MYKINFNKPLHVHFIGIGGISMSGLAEILLKENFTISGSDSKASALTEHLASMGASVFYPQKASNIIDGIDVVVYTAAIHEDNEAVSYTHLVHHRTDDQRRKSRFLCRRRQRLDGLHRR